MSPGGKCAFFDCGNTSHFSKDFAFYISKIENIRKIEKANGIVGIKRKEMRESMKA